MIAQGKIVVKQDISSKLRETGGTGKRKKIIKKYNQK